MAGKPLLLFIDADVTSDSLLPPHGNPNYGQKSKFDFFLSKIENEVFLTSVIDPFNKHAVTCCVTFPFFNLFFNDFHTRFA